MKTPAIGQDAWVQASWESFLSLADDPALEKAKFYYNHGWMRVEMSPVGLAHAEDNYLLAQIVSIYAFSRGLRLRGLTNVSLRKASCQEVQPDLAYYFGEEAKPTGSPNSPIDLNSSPAPALAVEVAVTSLQDDLTVKRELYGQLGVEEYWVVDSKGAQVLLFGAATQGLLLELLERSRLLPGLSAVVLTEALRLGRREGEAAAMQYILSLSG